MSRELARERMRQAMEDAAPARKISIDRLDDVELPPAAREIPVETKQEQLPAVTDPRGDLQQGVTKAIRFLNEVVDMDAGAIDSDTARMMSLQIQAAQTLINTQAKVDDTQLRARQVDMLPKLIDLMRSERQELKVIEHRP